MLAQSMFLNVLYLRSAGLLPLWIARFIDLHVSEVFFTGNMIADSDDFDQIFFVFIVVVDLIVCFWPVKYSLFVCKKLNR